MFPYTLEKKKKKPNKPRNNRVIPRRLRTPSKNEGTIYSTVGDKVELEI